METRFNEIKQEILRRAKEASACKSEYGRAYAAENLSELSQVIKNNFDWACAHGVLTIDLIEQYKEDFVTNGIYANQNVKSGYLLCNNATVEAYGNTIVEAYGNATVKAYDSATVVAYDKAKVEACDSATVKAYDNVMVLACDSATVEARNNAYCTSCRTIDCKLFDHAICRVWDTNTVYYADSDIKFVKQ